MVEHKFVCDACNILIKDSSTEVHVCPQCGEDMRWDLHVAIHGNYKTPIHSDSLAINPCQVAEHKKMFPNIELDGDCRPVFDNFQNHEAYLDKTGFVKLPKKLKTLGRKKVVIK